MSWRATDNLRKHSYKFRTMDCSVEGVIFGSESRSRKTIGELGESMGQIEMGIGGEGGVMQRRLQQVWGLAGSRRLS